MVHRAGDSDKIADETTHKSEARIPVAYTRCYTANLINTTLRRNEYILLQPANKQHIAMLLRYRLISILLGSLFTSHVAAWCRHRLQMS